MIPEITQEDIELVRQYLKKPHEIEYNGKTVNLFWSGGADSTFLLLALLIKGYCVLTIFVEIENNVEKNRREQEARDKIEMVIRMQFPQLTSFWHLRHAPEQSFKVPGCPRQSISQALYWLVATQSETRFSNDYCIGYVNGDDAIYYIPQMQKIIEAFNGMAEPEKQVTVSYPLVRLKKKWYWDSIDPMIAQHITWCESPYHTNPDTCSCLPCKRHRYEIGE